MHWRQVGVINRRTWFNAYDASFICCMHTWYGLRYIMRTWYVKVWEGTAFLVFTSCRSTSGCGCAKNDNVEKGARHV